MHRKGSWPLLQENGNFQPVGKKQNGERISAPDGIRILNLQISCKMIYQLSYGKTEPTFIFWRIFFT